ncbi:protein phosphatase CheZ [Dongia sp.]|uniref:protein phosphatase CheZ n=1 Tax=Dongia sp. TaxID=1977262 RepID=UPI0035B0973F
MTATVPPELVHRLSALKGRMQTVSRDEIAEVVTSLLATMEGDLSDDNLKLYSELESLAKYITTAKSEIAALRPDEITSRHLPKATDELDAIVGATEEATNSILGAMEGLEALAGELPPEFGEKVSEAVTQVYEACNFQDITGQRITKVVNALKHIEEKVEALVVAFGDEIAKYKKAHPETEEEAPEAKTPSDAELLNGPQLPDDASKQAEIDALLASFD